MALSETVGTQLLRTEFVDGMVKGFAEAQYKFKQAVTISSTSAWTNFFYREDPTALTVPTGSNANFRGLPRGAAFPQASTSWQRVQAVIEKYGAEEIIFWEDILADDIDVRNRTLFRIAEAVVKSVDDRIFVALSENYTNDSTVTLSINSVQATAGKIGTGTAGHWDEVGSAAIIDNLMQARQVIAENNYDVGDLICYISPRDQRSVGNYLATKGAQFPTVGTDVALNGFIGELAGIKLVVSNSVPASYALVVKPKICGTWKELVPLQTTTIEDKYRSLKIRAVEEGVTQLTDPKAVCIIYDTQA